MANMQARIKTLTLVAKDMGYTLYLKEKREREKAAQAEQEERLAQEAEERLEI